MPATLIGIALLLGLLVAIPTRRLAIAGVDRVTLSMYYAFLWIVSLLAIELRGGGRLLVPILLVAYLAPFVTWRAGIERLRARFGRRPGLRERGGRPMKDVTPHDAAEPPA